MGITVLAVMHDLNLAALYFDRVALLAGGTIRAQGTPSQILTVDLLEEVFGTPIEIVSHPTTGGPYVVVLPRNGWHREETELFAAPPAPSCQ